MNIKQRTIGYLRDISQKFSFSAKIQFFIFGIASTAWFLMRVLPKPSRAGYPCVRAAAPVASAFVLYLLSLASSVVFFRKTAKYFRASRIPLAALFLVLGASASVMSLVNNLSSVSAVETPLEGPNQPMGGAKGISPGRVVWVYSPDATNESCTNAYGDGYFMDSNTDQVEVDAMLQAALKSLTGESTVTGAWDAVFKYHNQTRGKGRIGYNSNEIVFIKTNATSTWWENINSSFGRVDNGYFGIAETSPQVVLSVLRQLVNTVGVPQDKIYVGDPMKNIYQDNYDKWHNEFPNVHYLDHSSNGSGREKVIKSTTAMIKYSDRGTILGQDRDTLYTIFEDMEYMINIPTLKGHERAGASMFGKNHFGSITTSGADHLHGGLVKPDPNADSRNTYGLYRVQVDIMAHELLGKKNLIYLMDALYCGPGATQKPTKWHIAPFNNDWTSSLFLSQDPVAIESVGFDFLYAEYDGLEGRSSSPHLGAVDDYLHQLSEPSNRPAGIEYDPENDGTPIVSSQGSHEHWNNSTDKQYSGNLGTGSGIELVQYFMSDPPSQVQATGVTLSPTSLSLTQGETAALVATVSPSNATNKAISWSSANEAVAKVDANGVVEAVGPGETAITVVTKDGGHTATCTVVSYCKPLDQSAQDDYIKRVVLNTIDNTSGAGPGYSNFTDMSTDLTANNAYTITIYPGTTTYEEGYAVWIDYNRDSDFDDSDELVFSNLPTTATSVSGTFTVPSGALSGTTRMRVIMSFGQKPEGPCDVFNYGEVEDYGINILGSSTVPVTGVSLAPGTLSLNPGQTSTLTATVLPSNASDKSVSWSSSDEKVATVSQSGAVTAVAAGSATITVTTNDGSKTASCTVTVTNPDVPVTGVTLNTSNLDLTAGETSILTATVSPSNATNKTVSWTSDNEGVATVSVGGLVTAVSGGSAIITVTTADGGKIAACTVTVTVPVTGVALSSSNLSLAPGQTSTLVATVSPSNATNKSVSWASSDENVATVSQSGAVTAVAAGSATITVTTNNGSKTAICSVTVANPDVPVTGVTLNTSNLGLTPGQTSTLTATVSPSNATNKAVNWTSDNEGVATVSSSGLVTAVSGGSAIITVTTVDGGKTAACTVTVTVPVTGVALSSSNLSLAPGQTSTLVATVSPSNATNKSVSWSSSDENVATVDQSGSVTAVAAGSATITVTTNNGSKTASCTVTVINPDVPVTGVTLNTSNLDLTAGETSTLTATVSPSNATNKTVSWTSDNEGVATVSSRGLVTAVSGGSAIITVTTADGSKTAVCTVSVTVPVTGVALSSSNLSLAPGQTSTLAATVSPSNASDKSVSWASSDEKVATVSQSGAVTGVAAGSATITVTTNHGSKTASCTVTVTNPDVPVTGVELSPLSLILTPGQTTTLAATVSPSNATNKAISWLSGNTSVATVDVNGLVTAISEGATTITVTTQDGNYVASCDLMVYCTSGAESNPGYSYYMFIDKVKIGNHENASGDDSGYKIFRDQPIDLETGSSYDISLCPGFGTDNMFEEYWYIYIDLNRNGSFADAGELIYDPGNSSSSCVNGTITIPSSASAGKTMMRVSMQYQTGAGPCEAFMHGEVEDYEINITASGSVPVTDVSLDQTALCLAPGQTSTLAATVSPSNASNKAVSWLSGNTSVATVDANGLVTAKSEGATTITVTTLDGNYVASCDLMVYCTSKADSDPVYSALMFIDNIKIGNYENASGDDSGYKIFRDQPIDLETGSSYDISLCPGFSADVMFEEYWYIYIDLNRNGSFADAGELIYDPGNRSAYCVNGIITIPSSASVGKTMMRVSMQYQTGAGPCETLMYGEVEDYEIKISAPAGISVKSALASASDLMAASDQGSGNTGLMPETGSFQSLPNIEVYPNPAQHNLFVNNTGAGNIISTRIFDINGKTVRCSRNGDVLDISRLSRGLYVLWVEAERGTFVKKFIKQ